MKQICDLNDFLYWAKQVNLCFSTTGLPDLQDIFARSDYKKLHKIFMEAEYNDRRHMIFGIYKAMSDDVFFDYINLVIDANVNRIMEKEELELSNKWAEFKQAEIELDEKREQIKIHMQAVVSLCDK